MTTYDSADLKNGKASPAKESDGREIARRELTWRESL